MTINDDSGEFKDIPEKFKSHLAALGENEQKELLGKLRLYLKEKPSKEVMGKFEATNKRITEIENVALKKLRDKGSNDES